MKPNGRFSPTSTGPAGFGAVIVRELVVKTGRAKVFGGAGGRLKGLVTGSLAISAIICGAHGLLPSLIVGARLTRAVADLEEPADPGTIHVSTAIHNTKFDRTGAGSHAVVSRGPPPLRLVSAPAQFVAPVLTQTASSEESPRLARRNP
jgi:hypothetical protein